MNNNMTGFRLLSKTFKSLCFVKVALALERVNGKTYLILLFVLGT